MNEEGKDSNSQKEQSKSERKFSQEQYDMLKRCSEKKDIAEWNEWREKHRNEEIRLQKADLRHANLQGADLKGAELQGAIFQLANLQNAQLQVAKLHGAMLEMANLQGAKLFGTELQGAYFSFAVIDNSVQMIGCFIDRNTDFSETNLDSVRMESGIKYLLKYNIRRRNWENWYISQSWCLRWTVRKFWNISDYGISTKQVMRTFLKWAMIFAVIYYVLGAVDYYILGVKDNPGAVVNLFVEGGKVVSWNLVPLRSIYFSIVTMTTLGFGDIYANVHNSCWGGLGHLLLMVQVILGYVLLGAIVTRLAILFTADGPAGSFWPLDEKQRN